MKDALEMRIAHADLVHVIEGVADVVDARTAHADALRHQARTAVQVELAHIGGVGGIGDEREGAHGLVLDLHRNQPRLVDAARHLPVPETRQRAPQAWCIDAVSHAPARAAAAQAHHQAGLAVRAAVARRQDAERAVVTVRAAERLLLVLEAGRPHERAVAEHPEVAFRQSRAELAERHCAATI
jgi:hypothetical protein